MTLHIKWAIRSAALLVVLPVSAFACDVCGAFIGVTPYDNQSGFGIYHRYSLFSRISTVEDQPLVPSGAYRLQPQHSVAHVAGDTSSSLQRGDFESHKTIELRGKWFVHNRVEVNVLAPFVMTRMRSGMGLEKMNGLGDVSCWIGFHVLKQLEADVKQRLVLGLGVKLPTGKSDLTDEDGERYHLYMQPGLGSVDETVYIQYSLGWRKWGLAFNATAKRNGGNSFGEQIRTSTTSTANFFYMIKKENTVILPQIQLYAEECPGYTVNGIYQSGSDIGMLMSGIGCDTYFGRMGVHFTAQIPVTQIHHADSPGATFRGAVGVSWNVNQQKYLIN